VAFYRALTHIQFIGNITVSQTFAKLHNSQLCLGQVYIEGTWILPLVVAISLELPLLAECLFERSFRATNSSGSNGLTM